MTVTRHTLFSPATYQGGPGESTVPASRSGLSLSTRHSLLSDAFTLIEMLTVIAIIAIIAGFAIPVFKNFGKSDVTVSASRQLLDDVGRARQLAMSDRTTVYMVFLPTNFWVAVSGFSDPDGQFYTAGSSPYLTPSQQLAATNLLDKQLVGYTYMAYGALGDQPGQHQWHYLASWQSLPQGVYIPLYKFYNSNPNPPYDYSFTDPVNPSVYFDIYPFNVTNTFPFPTQDSTNASAFGIMLPYIAFNYLGQLSDYSGNLLTSQNEDQDYIGGGIDIPLVQGSVLPNLNTATRALNVGPPQINDMPPGNGTNTAYNVVHIDPLTGRATLEYHKMQ
jgi:prepilin-type N-terminal cleavage/methylation domain-containing protein